MSDKISLDSNVFRNQWLIDWLVSPEAVHKTHFFPLIAYIEVLVWYEMRGLTREDLDDDLKKIKTEIIEFSIDFIDPLMNSIRYNPNFLFRQHARNFLIGSVVQEKGSILITNNKRHFTWLLPEDVLTPEEYLKNCISLKKEDSAL